MEGFLVNLCPKLMALGKSGGVSSVYYVARCGAEFLTKSGGEIEKLEASWKLCVRTDHIGNIRNTSSKILVNNLTTWAEISS